MNITARESQIFKIDQLAERVGMTRSAYMVHSAISEEKEIERGQPRQMLKKHKAAHARR